jgi:hypothetical protein
MSDSKYLHAEGGSGNSVIYTDSDGKKFQFSGGNWTWRNHNPGNLRPGAVSRRNGQIGVAGGFAVFPDFDSGNRALKDSLKVAHGNESLEQMIQSYAPPKENDTPKYLRFLRKRTGVKDNRKISSFSKAEFEKLWQAISVMEGKPKEGTIIELKDKKRINGVKKNKKGTITAYHVEGLGWIPKPAAIRLTKTGEIDAVTATSRSGKLFLRTRPDKSEGNNLGVIAKFHLMGATQFRQWEPPDFKLGSQSISPMGATQFHHWEPGDFTNGSHPVERHDRCHMMRLHKKELISGKKRNQRGTYRGNSKTNSRGSNRSIYFAGA